MDGGVDFALECRHTAVLLEVVVLSRSITRMEEDVTVAFNYLVMRRAAHIWKGLPRAWCCLTMREKRDHMVDEIHRKCCPPGAPSTGADCYISIAFEQEVMRAVNHMGYDEAYVVEVLALAREEGTAVIRKPRPAAVRRTKRRLNARREHLLNRYFPVAVWKRETGRGLSALEKLLVTEGGLVYLGLDALPDAGALLETVANGIMCIDNASMCRGCFRTGRRRGRRPLPCSGCKRVYFCCDDCLLSGSVGRHGSLECPMLTGDWRE